MRTWIVGVFCALLGGYAAWKGVAEDAWLFAAGGVALAVASLTYVARPGRKSLGAIEVCWGAVILGYTIGLGQGTSLGRASSSGSVAAAVLAGVLIIAGISNLTRAKPPEGGSPADVG